MSKHDQLLENAEREELLRCIRLLSMSIAQHRKQFGNIPMVRSFDLLEGDTQEEDIEELRKSCAEVTEEAISLIAEEEEIQGITDAAQVPPAILDEQRDHARVTVSAEILLRPMQNTWQQPARLRDLSWGGASFVTQLEPHDIPSSVILEIAAPNQLRIFMETEILRATKEAEGTLVSSRVSMITTQSDRLFEWVLEKLLEKENRESGQEPARVARRLEMLYGDDEEFASMLEDVSTGGLLALLPEPLDINASVQLVLSTTDGKRTLTLRARAVHQHPFKIGDIMMYHVGLQIQHPLENIKKEVSVLTRQIALSKNHSVPLAASQGASSEKTSGDEPLPAAS